jgi:uncharacterized protein YueI
MKNTYGLCLIKLLNGINLASNQLDLQVRIIQRNEHIDMMIYFPVATAHIVNKPDLKTMSKNKKKKLKKKEKQKQKMLELTQQQIQVK